MAVGHMNYFNVNECGLYKYQDAHSHGCALDETFELIHQWVLGRTMSETLPWDPSTSRSGSPKCYCHDIYKDDATGDFLLVLWKSEGDETGTVWGAQENGAMGEGRVIKYTDTYKGRKVIWGRPCYYWVVPSHNVVISIKFDFSVCDSNLFQDWVTACINNRVDHPDKKRETTESGAIRLSYTRGNGAAEQRYRFGFDVTLKTLSTSSKQLGALAAKVTHVLRRETVTLASARDERAEWVKLFDKLPYLAAKPKTLRRQIEIRAEAKPTATEIKQIIEQFAKVNRRRADWENVGFVTEDGILWVDSYRLKNMIELDHNANEGTLTAAALYSQIEVDRDDLLAPLSKPSRMTRKTA